jgi:hypothetical protein
MGFTDVIGNGLQFIFARLVRSFHLNKWARMSDIHKRQMAKTGWLATTLAADGGNRLAGNQTYNFR